MAAPDGGSYRRRIVDDELDLLLAHLPAVSLSGPKGVGKTATGAQRARSTFDLDRPDHLELLAAAPEVLITSPPPVLVDEWQRYPASWDLVRREVDRDRTAGRFLLTGSAAPLAANIHSGAGRMVEVRMRPMSLAERGLEQPAVSLSRLLAGDGGDVEGSTDVGLVEYVREIGRGGFPGMQQDSPRAQRAILDSYVRHIVDRDVPEAGLTVRNVTAFRRWLTAYAAATGTTAAFEKIRDATATGQTSAPTRATVIPYRDALERIWIADPVPAWTPSSNRLSRLTISPKHFLTDPALAMTLLELDERALLTGGADPGPLPRRGSLLGSLFEALNALNLRVYAQAAEASVGHFRTRSGEHEVDFIVTGRGGRVVAIESKLSQSVDDHDVRQLLWLRDRLGSDLADAVVLTTGRRAYRRRDGIAVVPAALLGP